MKRSATQTILSVFLILIVCSAVLVAIAAPQPNVQEGTYIGTSLAFTNQWGRQYVVLAQTWGVFDGSNACSISVNSVLGSSHILVQSTTTTNTLTYADGDAAQLLDGSDVVIFQNSGGAAATNGYRLIIVPKQD